MPDTHGSKLKEETEESLPPLLSALEQLAALLEAQKLQAAEDRCLQQEQVAEDCR